MKKIIKLILQNKTKTGAAFFAGSEFITVCVIGFFGVTTPYLAATALTLNYIGKAFMAVGLTHSAVKVAKTNVSND